jgi:hypothetical protein
MWNISSITHAAQGLVGHAIAVLEGIQAAQVDRHGGELHLQRQLGRLLQRQAVGGTGLQAPEQVAEGTSAALGLGHPGLPVVEAQDPCISRLPVNKGQGDRRELFVDRPAAGNQHQTDFAVEE